MPHYSARHSLHGSDGDRFVRASTICSFVNHQATLGRFTDDVAQMRASLDSLASDNTQKVLAIDIVQIAR